MAAVKRRWRGGGEAEPRRRLGPFGLLSQKLLLRSTIFQILFGTVTDLIARSGGGVAARPVELLVPFVTSQGG